MIKQKTFSDKVLDFNEWLPNTSLNLPGNYSINNPFNGDNKDKILYESDLFECFLINSPRAEGHTVISSKKHYKDMMEIPDDLCKEIFVFAKMTVIGVLNS